MPIIVGDKPIFRIKFKDADIREVRKGNELEWGLYLITYKNSGPIKIQTAEQVEIGEQKNISKYVWGYPNQGTNDFYLWVPGTINGQDMGYKSWTKTTSSDGWNMRADGWFENAACTEDKYLSYIPATSNDFHKDLTLYCKWTMRQYGFTGTCTWKIFEQTGGSSSFGERDHAPLPNESPYPWSDSPNLSMPNCTWYATWRAMEAFNSAPVYGDRDAKNWISGGYDSDWTVIDLSQASGGDIVVYGGNSSTPAGHVAFVEPSGKLSGSWWTNVVINGTQTSWQDSSGHWHNNRYLYWNTAGDLANYAYSNYPTRYWHNHLGTVSNPYGEFSGTVLGVLHYTGSGGGGGGEWQQTGTGSYSYNNIICGDSGGWNTGTKTEPVVPEVYDQEDEDRNPGTHWKRDQKWTITSFTNEKYLKYDEDPNGKWTSWSNKTSGTQTDVPPFSTNLNGWLLDWE